jgi:electron transfer flavoprotein beta subunit
VVAVRANESVQVELEAALPAVVSVVEKINTPRYPNFKGIMAAKKKTVDVWSLSDLGVSVGDSSGAGAVVAGVVDMPARSGGVVVTDAAGDSVSGLVAFMESRKVI